MLLIWQQLTGLSPCRLTGLLPTTFLHLAAISLEHSTSLVCLQDQESGPQQEAPRSPCILPLPGAYSSSSFWVPSVFPDLGLLYLWPEGSPWQWRFCWLLCWYICQQASGDRPCLLGSRLAAKARQGLVGVGDGSKFVPVLLGVPFEEEERRWNCLQCRAPGRRKGSHPGPGIFRLRTWQCWVGEVSFFIFPLSRKHREYWLPFCNQSLGDTPCLCWGPSSMQCTVMNYTQTLSPALVLGLWWLWLCMTGVLGPLIDSWCTILILSLSFFSLEKCRLKFMSCPVPHSCSSKETEDYINYKVLSLLSQAYY